MSKKVIKRKKAVTEKVNETPNALSHSLTQLYYEIDTVKLEIEAYSDEDLFDYCLPHLEMYSHRDLDSLYPKLVAGKKLEQAERKALEGFCILVNTHQGLIA